MKIVLIGGSNVIHTIRWVNALSDLGHKVYLIDCHIRKEDLNSNVIEIKLPFSPPFGYLSNVFSLKKKVEEIAPDIINVHYASGYGFLCRLSRLSVRFPVQMNVWGSDVYDFPEKSIYHRKLIQGNLLGVTSVASTSYCMARVVKKIEPSINCFITPFGVDSEKFKFTHRQPINKKKTIIIGTVKRLMDKYGIDTLIESFSILCKQLPDYNLQLKIVGEGPDEKKLKTLALELNLRNVFFEGACNNDKVPNYLNEFDIFVALSRFDSESFGVAIVEAALIGIPVVVSDTDGPTEVVTTLQNGFVVPKNDPLKAANKLNELIKSESTYSDFSQNGYTNAIEQYEWSNCLIEMETAYNKTISKFIKNKVIL